mgnify:CR=1 FL=1
MIVSSSKIGWVSLDNLVRIEEGTGPSAIDRLNRERQVTLLANVKPGGSQAAVIQKMNQFAKEVGIDSAYKTGLAGRSKELGRAGYYFMLAFVLSFVFMYMVLAAQFESFIHPVTILLTLPLAIPFGILALLITGQTVNIFPDWDCCCCLAWSRRTQFCRSITRISCAPAAWNDSRQSFVPTAIACGRS